jgi:hypothetical protein
MQLRVIDRRFHGWGNLRPMAAIIAMGLAGWFVARYFVAQSQLGIGRSEEWSSVSGPIVIVCSVFLAVFGLAASLAVLGVAPLGVGIVTSKHIYFGVPVEYLLGMVFRAPRAQPGPLEVEYRRMPMSPPNARFVAAWRYRRPGEPWRSGGGWKEPTRAEREVLTARLESLGFTVTDVTPSDR